MKRMNTDLIDHNLRLCGMTAYRQTLLDLADQINQLQEHVEQLQRQVSAEIPAPPAELREIVEELGAGWRIERQPSDTPAVTTTIDDIDRQMTGVGRLLTSYQRAFIQDVDAALQSG